MQLPHLASFKVKLLSNTLNSNFLLELLVLFKSYSNLLINTLSPSCQATTSVIVNMALLLFPQR